MPPDAQPVVFDHVWKKFKRGERHDSLRDLIPALARGLMRRASPTELRKQEFWALQDVSFRVEPGQALGIIGPNGAGKSTILKILTRLFRPTAGDVRIHGRAGSLLEIGGSLHPDLTGRENVFLQGSILGMKRAEVARKFDEIVAFAEVPDFIDTAVKRYSSGMRARLGFAVAAHLEADVLLIDEVLAVGDSAFQKKAFGRMGDMVRRGVPTVTVSHQLERIASLCSHAILLTKGRVACAGTPGECITAYGSWQALAAAESADGRAAAAAGHAPDATDVRLDSLAALSAQPVPSGEPLRLRLLGWAPPPGEGARRIVGIRVRDLQTGAILFGSGTATCGVELPDGSFEMEVELSMNVAPGIYAIETSVWHWRRERDARNGPATLVHVGGGPSFTGTVQMELQMRVAAAPANRQAIDA